MRRKFSTVIWILIIVLCLAACSSPAGEGPEATAEAVSFTDALGRSVSLSSPARVGICSGSLAECWLLAGGEVAAVTRDVAERDIVLPEDVIDLGSLKDPSLEAILAAEPDFMILTPSLSSHVAMGEALERAGVAHAYFDVEYFEDYLDLMRLFTQITGREDLYEQNAASVVPQIEAAIASVQLESAPSVLVIRTSASKIKALSTDTMVGAMLADFGCINIAEHGSSLLNELSLEVIAQEDPDFIFVVCMGDEAEARAQLAGSLAANPIWDGLSAVQGGNCHFLEKELFHYKPNAKWGESYEALATLITGA